MVAGRRGSSSRLRTDCTAQADAGPSTAAACADAAGGSGRGSARAAEDVHLNAAKSVYVTAQDVTAINELRQKYLENLPCKLTDNDLNECVGEVMRHILASNSMKPQVPVPNSQLAKLLKKVQVSKSGITKPVVSVAKQRFLALGWELCEIGFGAGVSYLLRSALPVQFMNEHVYTSQDSAFIALKLILQMFLHTKGDKAGKDQMRSFLSKFGVHLPAGQYAAEASDLDATSREFQHNYETFGHGDPVQALLEQKFLKLKLERALNGADEELFMLGDAGTEVNSAIIAENIESLMAV